MRRTLFPIFVVAALAAWCPQILAQPQSIVGAAPTALAPQGVTGGVAMTAQGGGGTLLVGTQDIFTNNSGGPFSSFAVTSDVASQSNIVFGGNSTVFGTIGSGAIFLNLTANNAATTVNWLGTINTTTYNVGTGTVNFGSGTGTNVGAGIFTGDGTITLAPNTGLTGAITSPTATAGVPVGTLVLNGGSFLTGAVGGGVAPLRAINVVGGNNIAGVSAQITGAVLGVNTLSLGTNTLNINGALTITSGGLINTTLASPSVFGRVLLGANNASYAGASLGVNVLVPSGAFIPVGSQFVIVQAGSGSNIPLDITIQNPTNPLYKFSSVPGSGAQNGQVIITTDAIPLQAAPLPVVSIVLGLPLTPDLTEVLAAVNAFSNPADVIDAVAQFNPSAPDLAAPMVTFSNTRQFHDLWSSRLDDVLCSQTNKPDDGTQTCRKNDPHRGWWLKGFGYFGDQDTRGLFKGYDSRTGGAMLGYDVPLGVGTRAGLGVGYSRTTIDGDFFDNDTDFDTYQATAYVGHESGPWYVNGSMSFGWNDYDSKRHILFTGVDRTAKSDYDGQAYTAFASTGYHILKQGYTITPLASLQYTHMEMDSHTESGAGDLNLNIQSRDYNFLESGLGAKVERPVGYLGGVAVPEVHGKWLHEFSNPSQRLTAEFASASGSSFTTNGPKSNDDTFNVGAGLTFLSCECTENKKQWALEAVYDYYWKTDGYSAHQGIVKLSASF